MKSIVINHQCGHSETHEDTGGFRAGFLEWLKTNDCTSCFKQNEENKCLPKLINGTEKQIAWAENIRKKAIGEMKNSLRLYKAKHEHSQRAEAVVLKRQLNTKAKYWIDMRTLEFNLAWLEQQCEY